MMLQVDIFTSCNVEVILATIVEKNKTWYQAWKSNFDLPIKL